MDLPDKDIGCHRTGFEKKCRQLVCDGICNRWIEVMGMNPQSGEQIKHYDCVDNWMPTLMLENSQQQRQTAAAVESFRNEMVKMNEASNLIELAKLHQMASNNSQIEHKGDANS